MAERKQGAGAFELYLGRSRGRDIVLVGSPQGMAGSVLGRLDEGKAFVPDCLWHAAPLALRGEISKAFPKDWDLWQVRPTLEALEAIARAQAMPQSPPCQGRPCGDLWLLGRIAAKAFLDKDLESAFGPGDLPGRLLDCACRLLAAGHASGEPLPPELDARVLAGLAGVVDEEGLTCYRDFRKERRDGELCWAMMSALPPEGEAGTQRVLLDGRVCTVDEPEVLIAMQLEVDANDRKAVDSLHWSLQDAAGQRLDVAAGVDQTESCGSLPKGKAAARILELQKKGRAGSSFSFASMGAYRLGCARKGTAPGERILALESGTGGLLEGRGAFRELCGELMLALWQQAEKRLVKASLRMDLAEALAIMRPAAACQGQGEAPVLAPFSPAQIEICTSFRLPLPEGCDPHGLATLIAAARRRSPPRIKAGSRGQAAF